MKDGMGGGGGGGESMILSLEGWDGEGGRGDESKDFIS